MKIAFTICSLNYFAQALSLGESLSKTNPQYKYIIGLTDKLDELYSSGDAELISLVEKNNIIETDKLDISDFESFSLKYNILELNAAVKPYYFDYFFRNTADLEYVVYLDPDILVYANLEDLDKHLKEYHFVITPHILSPLNDDGLLLDEKQINNTGLYNLGFIAARYSEESQRFINWWKERLYKYCYVRFEKGLFADQIWINFLPIFVEKTLIERDLGYNVAYWNLHERSVCLKNKEYTINGETKLKFYHFSGFFLKKPDMISKYQNRYTFEQRGDIKPLFDDYIILLNKYLYDKFRNLECFYIKRRNEHIFYNDLDINPVL